MILVAHNGKRFDIPFLLIEFQKNNIQIPEYFTTYGLDTMLLANQVLPARGGDIPLNYSLNGLYNYITGQDIQNAHRALSDAHSAAVILQYNMLWQQRKKGVFVIDKRAIGVNSDIQRNNYDSDDDEPEDDDSEEQITNVEEEQDNEDTHMEYDERGYCWERNCNFDPSESSTIFGAQAGLKYSASNFNTPIRAWRQIFTNYLLNMIVKYTNDYGEVHCKDWVSIDQNDLLDFITILFLTSIQKRKDKPSNWFSSDPVLECPQAKRIMSGKQFSRLLSSGTTYG